MWMETPENDLVTVDSSDKEPRLAIDQSLMEEAMEHSKNPALLKQTIDDVVSSINQKSDEYMDLPGWDRWEYNTEDVDAQNGMQEIADNINKAFANFQTNEKTTTDTMLSEIQQIDTKFADILSAYREPTLGEKVRWVAYGSLDNNSYAAGMKKPWSKRVKK